MNSQVDLTRKQLIQQLKRDRQRLEHVRALGIEWGRFCHSAAMLAGRIGQEDSELANYLATTSAKAGQRALACNQEMRALTESTHALTERLVEGDKLLTWRELRDEESEWVKWMEE